MMNKVLVTGSTGVLGTRLVESLNSSFNEVESFSGDITDLEVIRSNLSEHADITHLFHLAAVVPTDEVSRNFSHALNVNAYATGLLLSSLIESDLNPWFCYISSSHVYEPSSTPLREDSCIDPSSAYGLTKYLGEINLNALSASYAGSIVIARVFSYYDELQRESFLYPVWANRLQSWDGESELEVFGGDSVRDFSHATDVVRHLENLMRNEVCGVVNIGSGHSQKVVDFLKERFGDHYPFKSAGAFNTIVPDLTKLKSLRGEKSDQIS